MPNLRGASPVDRDEGGRSYATRMGGKADRRRQSREERQLLPRITLCSRSSVSAIHRRERGCRRCSNLSVARRCVCCSVQGSGSRVRGENGQLGKEGSLGLAAQFGRDKHWGGGQSAWVKSDERVGERKIGRREAGK